jgi:aspartyl-tRNA(Asn)/glutamyl-tRNA(Gln) amidotransferase subunit B
LIDLNRAGVPLVEIVSRPDITSPEQAREYVGELRSILLAIGASDAKMEEGSMRVDANVSVRKPGEPYGTRCEIKNVNSIRSIGRAIEYEAKRQIQMLQHGEKVRQQTRHWDEADNRTHTLRDKEEADDYRYFLEPDLVPVAPSPAWIEEVRAGLPTLPAERRRRLSAVAGVPVTSEALMSIVERGQDEYALAVVAAGGDAGRAIVHLKEAFAEAGSTPDLPAAALAGLTRLEVDGSITATQAKSVLARMIQDGGGDAASIAAEMGFEAMDSGALEAIVDEAIAAQPDAWAKYLAGERKALGAIVGQVMKASKGQADGKLVNEIVAKRAGEAN